MATIALSPGVGAYTPVKPDSDDIKNYFAAEAITPGKAIYENTSGKAGLARANAVGTSFFVGISLTTAAAGQPVAVLRNGPINCFVVSGTNAGKVLYVSATVAGEIVDTAPSTSTQVVVPIGFVDAMTDSKSAPTRLVHVYMNPHFVPVALA